MISIPSQLLTFLSQIMSAPRPRHTKSSHAGAMVVEPELLAEPDSEGADSLVSSNDPDDLANEQTWPTEDEMRGPDVQLDGDDVPDATAGTTPKSVRRIPKGMSEYQASWIVDEDDGEDGEEDEDGEREEMQEIEMDDAAGDVEVEEEQDMEMDSRRSVAFQDLDAEEEDRQ